MNKLLFMGRVEELKYGSFPGRDGEDVTFLDVIVLTREPGREGQEFEARVALRAKGKMMEWCSANLVEDFWVRGEARAISRASQKGSFFTELTLWTLAICDFTGGG